MKSRTVTSLAAGALLVSVLSAIGLGAPRSGAESNETLGPGFALQGRISLGQGHTCAIFDKGELKCWGRNADGQLGLGDIFDRGDSTIEMGVNLQNVDLGANRTARAVAAGGAHTCAILDNASVKCWGANNAGQLGIGNPAPRGAFPNQMGDALPAVDLGTGRTATAISAGFNHTCVTLDDGTAKCWGSGDSGQIGQQDFANRGDRPAQMGDALKPISLGAGLTVKHIATGYNHTCFLLNDDTVKCIGSNASGELGYGDTVRRGGSETTIGDLLPRVELGSGRTVRSISAGFAFTCAVLDNNQTKCWGANDFGQLGLGDRTPRGNQNLQMGNFLPALDIGGVPVVLSLGGAHACAMLETGLVKCWGFNGVGTLGLGDVNPRGDNPGEMGGALPAVNLGSQTPVALTTGESHTCAVTQSGLLKCWGFNDRGQLGLGDQNHRGDQGSEMGDSLPVLNLASTVSQLSRFVPVNPARIFDTRSNGTGLLAPNATVTVPVIGRGGVPTNAVAVVLNVTTTATNTPGWVTVYPADRALPASSNLNVEKRNQEIANLVTVPLSGDGRVRMLTTSGGHLIADVFGYYEPTPGTSRHGRFFPMATPRRLLDTRGTGQVKLNADEVRSMRIVGQFAPFGIPDGASAIVLNVTVTQATGPGFVTLWPADRPQPATSNLNTEGPTQTIANQVIIPVSADGSISFAASTAAHLVIDIDGYYSGTFWADRGFGLFIPTNPTRVLDTRRGAKVGPSGVAVLQVADTNRPPETVFAAVLNVTATDTTENGYISAYPAGIERPLVSNLFADRAKQTIPNHVQVGAGAGAVTLFSESGSHLIGDLFGYFTAP